MPAKTLLLCIALSVVATASDVFRSQEVDTFVKECAKETNTAESEVNNPNILFSTPPENILCMGKCLGEKMKIIDSDGTIVQDKISEIISEWPKELQTATLECGEKIKKISTCDDMEEYRKCMQPAVEAARKKYH